jgi:RNA polymerase sigma-70 factor, ECF subfamily
VDSTLVERARTGDSRALEELLESLAPSIHRFGLRMCRNAVDAEDVLQDTLLSVATHLSDFEGRSSLSSWVFALTRSACSRKRRGLKNRPAESTDAIPEPEDGAPSPEQRAADKQLASTLATALEGLPEDYREVILLRDVEGLSAAEAAEALGVSVDALKSRLHRARSALRDVLSPLLEPSRPAADSGCPDILTLWSNKLEGDLSQADCATMERHMEACSRCGAACDALKRALGACRAVAADEVPAEVQARVKAAVRTAMSQKQAAAASAGRP